MMMVRLDPNVREARRNVRIQPETVDVNSVTLPDDKQLPSQRILNESDLQPVIF
jgi:hypothetical protein